MHSSNGLRGGMCNGAHQNLILSNAIQAVVQWIKTTKLVNRFVIFVFDIVRTMTVTLAQFLYRLHWEEKTGVCQWYSLSPFSLILS